MPAKKLMRATTTFHAPNHVTVREGDLMPSDDELVKRYGSFFAPAEDAVVRRVESAVVRPGG